MGFGGKVACNCFREGKTRPPPFDPSLLSLDGDGSGDVRIRIDDHLPIEEKQRLNHLFYSEWRKNCCEHESMAYADVFGGWAVLRVFQEAMEQMGEDNFPALVRVLPEGNYGCIPSEDIAAAEEELNRFENGIASARSWFLMDGETGRQLYDYVAGYGGQFLWGGTESAGFDPDGIWIRNDRTGEELFRCQRCLQRKKRKLFFGREYCQLMDLDTGQKFAASGPIIDGTPPPRVLEVARRALTPEDFPLIGWLRDLIRAAKITGNPITWY